MEGNLHGAVVSICNCSISKGLRWPMIKTHLKFSPHHKQNMNTAVSGCLEFNGCTDMNALLDGTNWLLLRNDGTRALIGGSQNWPNGPLSSSLFTHLAISIWLLVQSVSCHSTLCPSLSVLLPPPRFNTSFFCYIANILLCLIHVLSKHAEGRGKILRKRCLFVAVQLIWEMLRCSHEML